MNVPKNTIVHVAVGVMYNSNGQVLISKRPEHVHQGGKLEFPGGKVEQNETLHTALVREFEEELGVQIDESDTQPLICLTHHYADKSVKLDVWEVHRFSGTPFGKEGQAIGWSDIEHLNPNQFPEANVPIISALRLPKALMVTPDLNLDDALSTLPYIIKSSNASHCIVRLPSLSLGDYKIVWEYLKQQTFNTALIVHQHIEVAVAYHAPLHVRSGQLVKMSKYQLKKVEYISASVHNIEEQQIAQRLGVHFTVFGSIKETPTHQDHAGLGWEALSVVTQIATVPVYAIGGMALTDIDTARDCGAQGVAGIRLFS